MPSKKKILFISVKSVWGGAQKYVYDLASNLPSDEFEVIVALGGNGPLKEQLQEKHIRIIDLQYIEKRIGLFSDIRAFFEIRRIVRDASPDIVHLNGSKAGALGAPAAWASFQECNIIYSTHGLPYYEERPKWQNWLIFLTLRFATLFIDKIIAISRFDYEKALGDGLISQKNLVYIPISINSHSYNFFSKDEAKSTILSQTGLKGNGILIGTIAEYTRNKGLQYLIEAMAILGKNMIAETVIIGWGEEKNRLEKYIKQLGLTNNIKLLEIDHASQYLKAFDIFVLPSVKEGLPYTILEAGIAHVTIVASNVGGIPDVIKHENTGLLLEPRNAKALAQSLELIIKDQLLSSRLSESNYNNVTINFSLELMLEKTIDIYNN